jgi:uncharacterized protein YbjQ (UPF0145 family)
MICPNCGYDQQEGNVCGECHAFLKTMSAPLSQGVKQGWKEVKSPAKATGQEEPDEQGSTSYGNEPREGIGELSPHLSLPDREVGGRPEKPQELEGNGMTEDTIQSGNPSPAESINKQRPVAVKAKESAEMDPSPLVGQEVPLYVRRPKAKGERPLSMMLKRLQEVSVTTTENFVGKRIVDYRGIVHASAVVKLDTLHSFLSTVKEVSGLRNSPFQDLLKQAITIATSDLKIEAVKLNANAVVGVRIQYESDLQDALVVHVMGTAVELGPDEVVQNSVSAENG